MTEFTSTRVVHPLPGTRSGSVDAFIIHLHRLVLSLRDVIRITAGVKRHAPPCYE